MCVRVRFAPSPTGFVHIGSLRTALYNYLFAKKNEGAYVLRIEDTDQSRYVEGALENMLTVFDWAGIHSDEGLILNEGTISVKGNKGPYVQSERLAIYKKYMAKLLESGKAYYCFCSKERLEAVKQKQLENGETPRYDGNCRNLTSTEIDEKLKAGAPHVIRLKFPEDTDITFEDAVRGKITVNTKDLDDQILMKTDGFPTYHFAVVIDDHLMEISHVIRGEEWVISTPKHVFLYEAFGWDAPKFVHLPNILNNSRKKLSKRQDDVSVSDFEEKGYLPEGLINYLALVGWSPEGEKELFTLDELVDAFSLERISKSSGIFDVDKLNWINAHYIKTCDLDRLTTLSIPYFIKAGFLKESEVENQRDWIKNIMTLIKERIFRLDQIKSEVDVFFTKAFKITESESLEVMNLPESKEVILAFKAKISQVKELNQEIIKPLIKEVQKETGYKGKQLFMPIRVATTGSLHGPDLNLILALLGQERILHRLEIAMQNQ